MVNFKKWFTEKGPEHRPEFLPMTALGVQNMCAIFHEFH